MKFGRIFSAMFVLCLTVKTCHGKSKPKPSCGYPPSQWCKSLEIAIECKVQKQCMELFATRPDPAAPPVEVTLYYETLCPGCRSFITHQLFPTWTMLHDIMELKLVPYGNAKEIPAGNSQFTCQHGELECHGNAIQACVIHAAGQAAFPVVHCMESSADVLSAAQPCLQLYAPSVSWDNITSCVKGELGGQLMQNHGVKTRTLDPPHQHVPWVTFNGEHTDEFEDKAMSSLFNLVCNLYKGGKPPVCTGAQKKLDRSFC